jgi:hypothetical protein
MGFSTTKRRSPCQSFNVAPVAKNLKSFRQEFLPPGIAHINAPVQLKRLAISAKSIHAGNVMSNASRAASSAGKISLAYRQNPLRLSRNGNSAARTVRTVADYAITATSIPTGAKMHAAGTVVPSMVLGRMLFSCVIRQLANVAERRA